MNLSNIMQGRPLGRGVLEKTALKAVCECQYYDLADCMDATSSSELIDIIFGNYDCAMCGRKGGN